MKIPIISKNVIDVTKPPYNADNTGHIDCTESLRRVFDDVLIREVEGVRNTVDEFRKLSGNYTDNVYVGFENRVFNCENEPKLNVIYPKYVPSSRIIYFPKGTYLVSDTITYTLDNLKNVYMSQPFYELSRGIHILGESADAVLIKLVDNSAGFGENSKKPVISFTNADNCCEKVTSNVSQLNTIEDISIDCGKGNPGAVGIRFVANNSGRVQNVNILTECGYCGLHTAVGSEASVNNVNISGFKYGMDIKRSSVIVMENIDVCNNEIAGIYTDGAIINCISINSGNVPAFKFRDGVGGIYYFADTGITYEGELYNNRVYFEEKPLELGRLGIPKNCRSNNGDDWVCVDDFGAVGDGKTDSTKAIQKAMNSGKPIVVFGDGHYLLNGTVKIPATVKTVDFMFCDLISGSQLISGEINAAFDINEDSSDLLFMENLYTFEQFYGHFRCIRHTAKRDVVLSDFHNQASASYFNTVGGSTVYLDNCASTVGTYSYDFILSRRGYTPVFNHMIPYEFHNQTVYGRQVNPERADVELLNDGGNVFLDGYKVEGPGTAVKTVNGGKSQINVCTCGIGYCDAENALFDTDNSFMQLTGCRIGGFNERSCYNIIIKQETDGVKMIKRYSDIDDVLELYKKRLNFYNSKCFDKSC